MSPDRSPTAVAAVPLVPLDAPDHQGNPHRPDAPRPIAAAPPEIGAVLSVDPYPKYSPSGCAAVAAVGVIWFAASSAAFICLGDSRPTAAHGAAVALTVIATAVALVALLRRRPATSYVGEHGVAIFGGHRPAAVLLFADAARLYANDQPDAVRHNLHRVELGRTYAYDWEDADGRQLLLSLTGQRSTGGYGAPRRHPYHLARAAEAAWSRHLIARVRAQLAEGRPVDFPVAGVGTVRLADGWLELDGDGGGPVRRIGSADLASAAVTFGRHLELVLADGTRVRIPTAHLPNLVVFVWALDALMGVSVS